MQSPSFPVSRRRRRFFFFFVATMPLSDDNGAPAAQRAAARSLCSALSHKEAFGRSNRLAAGGLSGSSQRDLPLDGEGSFAC